MLKTKLHLSQKGSVTTEFIFVFPLFLIMAMFCLEVNFIWTDKHMARLGAWQAARTLALAPPEVANPCLNAELMERARYATLEKLPVVSPNSSYLESTIDNFQFSTNLSGTISNSGLPSGVKKYLNGYVYASVSTEIRCNYDADSDIINLTVNYFRPPKMPIIGKFLFEVNKLMSFDNNDPRSPRDQMLDDIIKLRDRINNLSVDTTQSLGHLTGVNDYAPINAMTGEISASIDEYKVESIRILDEIIGDANLANYTQSQLEALVMEISRQLPEPYFIQPVEAKVSIARYMLGNDIQVENGAPVENEWINRIDGVVDMSGDFRIWAENIGVDQGNHMQTGMPL